ncbi:hypothetical protein ACW9UR_13300 [Halovulum sp. GXIMD14794]
MVEFPAPDIPGTVPGPFAGSFAAQQLDPSGILAVLTGALDGDDLDDLDLAEWAPNSFLGRIAAYRDAILEGRDMAEALAEARDLLAAQYPPERSMAAMQTDMDAIRHEMAGIRRSIADADRLVSAGEAFRLEPILADLQRLRLERETLRGDLLRAMDHAQTLFMIRELEDEIRLSMDDAARQLRAASGGVVPPEVEVEVQRLLEIDNDPRAALVDAVMRGPGDTPGARLNRTALR